LSYQHHNEATFLEGVQSLAPGHNMILDTDTGISRTERFYELKKMEFPSEIELEEAVFRYKKAFKRAISFRLRSDVKVGTCLSGGLDSSYVAKVASENYANKEAFTAITAKSLDASNDESHYAKQVVDAYCLNGKVVQPTEADFYNMMDDIIYIQEEPFATPSIFMQYFVMKMAGTEGCIVMLDGQGGDETLLGYERYFVPYLKSIKNPFTFVKQFFKLADNSRLSAKRLFLYYLYFGFGRIREKKVLHKNRHILKENQQYLDRDLSRAFERASGDLFQLQKKELCELQLPKLLKFEDRSSMAHSIEARVPFVDHELVELAVSLPQQHKIYNGWSKYVLRKSFGKNAPQNIVWRKDKFGFEAPTKKWMQDKAYFIDAIKGSGFMDHVVDKSCNFEKLEENALWKLYNVAKWAEMFNVTY
ncbi:MAG: asparagine synthase C-terminal domain-containing protein, partial [Eudoraea sp.]|nr:asparagine synthase C-terminal domain-containing protein [Eudoraea sp.]